MLKSHNLIPLMKQTGLYALAAAFLYLGDTSPASAAGFTDFLNNIVTEINNARRPLALIAIIVVGILFMFNVFDMRRAGQVIIGIIVAFSAAEIVDLITKT